MGQELRQRYAGSLAILAATGVAAVLVWMPAYLAFSASIALAIGWCVWLERHPAA